MEAFRVKLDKEMLVATICWETRSVGHPRKRSNFDMPKFGEFVFHAWNGSNIFFEVWRRCFKHVEEEVYHELTCINHGWHFVISEPLIYNTRWFPSEISWMIWDPHLWAVLGTVLPVPFSHQNHCYNHLQIIINQSQRWTFSLNPDPCLPDVMIPAENVAHFKQKPRRNSEAGPWSMHHAMQMYR